jgi:hypothetical protein
LRTYPGKRTESGPGSQLIPAIGKKMTPSFNLNDTISEVALRTRLSPLAITDATNLPPLADHCYLVGRGQRADVVWSEGDFLTLCEHMLNGNPLNHFLAAWNDKQTGEAQFAKAPQLVRADKRATWAWATITGKSKAKTSMGFYPSNAEGRSRWAAIDFDAHNGEHERARRWSLNAFSLLLRQPQLYLVLCTSGGGGFHLFIFARELYRVGDWIVLLKQVCQWIGAEIADGVCEIFPNEKAESQAVGKGIRAPGTFNPKTGKCSFIEAETTKTLMDSLPRTWSDGVGKVNGRFLRNGQELSLYKSTNTYSLSTRPLIGQLLINHPVERKGTRNGVLMGLIGDLVHKFGRDVSERIVKEHYERYRENIATSFEEHMGDFASGWKGMISKIINSLSPAERKSFASLGTEHQREGFVIVRAFAGAAQSKREIDFQIARASLADRLSITPPGAAEVIRKLHDVGAIERTDCYVRHRSSARYLWVLSCSK